MGQIALVEHRAHQVALFDPDTVLAGQDAAHFDAKPEDIRAKSLGPLDLVGLVGIVKNERVKVAVAGVEDIRYAQDGSDPTACASGSGHRRDAARGIVPSMQ